MTVLEKLRQTAVDADLPYSDLLTEAADEIEWLRLTLQEIADRNTCTCEPALYEQGKTSPNCPAMMAGDVAREALGQPIHCRGRLFRENLKFINKE